MSFRFVWHCALPFAVVGIAACSTPPPKTDPVACTSNSCAFGYQCVDDGEGTTPECRRIPQTVAFGDAEPPVVTDGGVVTDSGETGVVTYAVTCLPNLLAGRVDRALRFVAKVSINGASISCELQGLNKTSTNVSTVVGTVHKASAKFSQGTFNWDFVAANFPKEVNTIRDEDIAFSHAILEGRKLSDTTMCAELNGEITKPSVVPLDESIDVCLFEKVSGSNAPLPTYVREDFHCP